MKLLYQHSGSVHCFCIILDSHCAHAGFVLDDRQQYALRRRAAQGNLADAISGGALSLQAWQEAPCASQAPGMQQHHMPGATLGEPSGRYLTALHCYCEYVVLHLHGSQHAYCMSEDRSRTAKALLYVH